MAIGGLLGGNIPDWLGNWLLDQGVQSVTPSPVAPQSANMSPMLMGAVGLFDRLGSGGDSSNYAQPSPVNYSAMTPEELSNVISTGYTHPDHPMATVLSNLGLLGTGFGALGLLGKGVNIGGGMDFATEMMDLDLAEVEDYTTLDRRSEIFDMWDKSIQSWSPVEIAKGLFSGVASTPDMSTYNYSQDQIDAAVNQGLDPFGGLDPSPDVQAVTESDTDQSANTSAEEDEPGGGGGEDQTAF